MKKIITLTALFGAGILAGYISNTRATAAPKLPPPSSYTLTLNPQQINELWYVTEKSTAEHTTVKDVQAWITEQIGAQNLAAAKADSLQKSAGKQGSITPKKP